MINLKDIYSKKNELKKLTYYQRLQRYASVSESHTREMSELVMLERAYGGCLGTKSR